MPLKLLVGPPGSGKTSQILARSKEFTPSEHWDSVRILAPSVSDVLDLRGLILSDPEFPGVLGDPICTLSRFCSDTLEASGVGRPRIASDPQRLLILRDVIRDSAGYFDGVRESPGFVGELAREIALLRSLSIGPDDLKSAVSLAGERLCDGSRRKLLALANLHESYQRASAEAGLCDPEDVIERAIEAVRADPSLVSRFTCILVDGFAALSPRRMDFVRLLTEHVGEVVLAVERLDDRPEFGDSVTMLVGGTPRMETELVAEEIRKLARDGGFAFSEIAVVARTTRARVERLASVFREHDIPIAPHYRPLSESTLGRAALRRLGEIRDSGAGDPGEAVESLLRDAVPPEDEDRLKKHFAAWKSLRRILDGIEVQSGRTLSADEIVGLLESGIASGTYRVPGDDAGVSFVSAGALRGRKFRAVFLLGLVEGEFPMRRREDPFIAEHEREVLNAYLPNPLPLREDDRAEERRLFHAAAFTAGERLYLCRSAHDQFGRATRPSPFLDEVQGDPPVIERRLQDVVPPMERVETRRALVARTILDCCSASEEERHRVAAASYNLLLDAGALGPDDFELLSEDDESLDDRPALETAILPAPDETEA